MRRWKASELFLVVGMAWLGCLWGQPAADGAETIVLEDGCVVPRKDAPRQGVVCSESKQTKGAWRFEFDGSDARAVILGDLGQKAPASMVYRDRWNPWKRDDAPPATK